jgi:hypothetical protein
MNESSNDGFVRKMIAAADKWAIEAGKRKEPDSELREHLPGVPEVYVVPQWENGQFKGYYLGMWCAVN